MQLDTRSNVALYVWDYFYVTNWPAKVDEAAWATIERATYRILQSEPFLDAPMPPDVRLRSARCVRAAVRVAIREIARLSVPIECWVIDGLAQLAAIADCVIEDVADAARRVVVH